MVSYHVEVHPPIMCAVFGCVDIGVKSGFPRRLSKALGQSFSSDAFFIP